MIRRGSRPSLSHARRGSWKCQQGSVSGRGGGSCHSDLSEREGPEGLQEVEDEGRGGRHLGVERRGLRGRGWVARARSCWLQGPLHLHVVLQDLGSIPTSARPHVSNLVVRPFSLPLEPLPHEDLLHGWSPVPGQPSLLGGLSCSLRLSGGVKRKERAEEERAVPLDRLFLLKAYRAKRGRQGELAVLVRGTFKLCLWCRRKADLKVG